MNFTVIRRQCGLPKTNGSLFQTLVQVNFTLFIINNWVLAVQNCINSLTVFIVFICISICTIASVTCILQQTERGNSFDQTPHSYHPASDYTHTRTHFAHPWTTPPPLQATQSSYEVLNPRPRARILLSEVSICSEPRNWSVLPAPTTVDTHVHT
jgi:hypothetical protein